jgi:hypothetical protein
MALAVAKAIPEVSRVSFLEPDPIQTPAVVISPALLSVATRTPFDKVVVSEG